MDSNKTKYPSGARSGRALRVLNRRTISIRTFPTSPFLPKSVSQRFFQQINYSSSTEDSSAELLALQLCEQDEVLCITGSGARPLDLLTAAPVKISSIDFCAEQNHLLRLKMEAFRQLSYTEMCGFLGIQEPMQAATLRLQMFETLAAKLPAATSQFWRQHLNYIRRGVLYCGTWERLLRVLSFTTWLRRSRVKGLLACESLDAQRDYWEKHWTGWQFKTYLQLLSTRFLWTSIVREPGARLIPKDFNVAGYLHDCLTRMASHSLLRSNPYANLLFYGKYTSHCKLPQHLREENFDLVRARLDQVSVIDGDLDAYLRHHQSHFDAFSLSDFASYAPEETYEAVWDSVAQAARPGARFCERLFLVKRKLAGQHLRRDEELERELASIDHTCLYSFHAGSFDQSI